MKSFFVVALFPNMLVAKTLIFQSNDAGATASSQNVVQTQAVAVAATSRSNVNSELFFMVEQLKQEVMELRGLVEEQSFRLRQMESLAKDRYRDLDGRMQGIATQFSERKVSAQSPSVANVPVGEVAASSAIVAQSAVALTSGVVPVADANGVGAEVATPIAGTQDDAQKVAYQQAYDLVKDKNFPDAIEALHGFVERYPEGDLTGNAFYWLGEVYLVLPKLEQAKQAFSIVVKTFPGHRKVPDAMYKLAVAHDRLQEPAEAEFYLKKVQQEFPSSTAAKLASRYSISK